MTQQIKPYPIFTRAFINEYCYWQKNTEVDNWPKTKKESTERIKALKQSIKDAGNWYPGYVLSQEETEQLFKHYRVMYGTMRKRGGTKSYENLQLRKMYIGLFGDFNHFVLCNVEKEEFHSVCFAVVSEDGDITTVRTGMVAAPKTLAKKMLRRLTNRDIKRKLGSAGSGREWDHSEITGESLSGKPGIRGKSFYMIRDTFMEKKKLTYDEIYAMIEVNEYGKLGEGFLPEHKGLELEWVQFHAEHAVLQSLTKSEHDEKTYGWNPAKAESKNRFGLNIKVVKNLETYLETGPVEEGIIYREENNIKPEPEEVSTVGNDVNSQQKEPGLSQEAKDFIQGQQRFGHWDNFFLPDGRLLAELYETGKKYQTFATSVNFNEGITRYGNPILYITLKAFSPKHEDEETKFFTLRCNISKTPKTEEFYHSFLRALKDSEEMYGTRVLVFEMNRGTLYDKGQGFNIPEMQAIPWTFKFPGYDLIQRINKLTGMNLADKTEDEIPY